MTQEEKAKAYDKVLKQIKGCTPDENGFITIYPQEIFPELAESEDERMWKLIKKYVHFNISDMALNTDHITREYLESWVEKQSEKTV